MSRNTRDWPSANIMDYASPTDDECDLTRVSSQSHNNKFYSHRQGKTATRSRGSNTVTAPSMPIAIPANPNVIPGNTLPSAPASPPTPAPSPTPLLRRPSWSPAGSAGDSITDLDLDDVPLSRVASTTNTARTSYAFRHMSACFADMDNNERQAMLAELLGMCDGKTLAFVSSFVSPRLKRDPFRVLPDELCIRILEFVDDPTTLARSSQVSKRWRELVSDDMAWKSLCERHAFQRNEEGEIQPRARSAAMLEGDLHKFGTTHPYGMHIPAFGQIGTPLSSSAPDLLRHSTLSAHPAMPSAGPIARSSSKRLPTRPKTVSYRSHFKHRYLISKAWRGGGMLSSHTIAPEQGVVTSLHLTQNYIVVGLDNAKIHVFGPTGEHLRSLHGHHMGVWAMAPYEDTLVSGGCDRHVRVWDLSTGQGVHILQGHTSTVRCIKIAPARGPGMPHLAISGSRDMTLRVWDITRGICRHVLQGHQASVRCLDIHGDIVVSGSYDTTARIWSISEGRCLRILQGHFSQIYAVAYDGRRVATGSLDTSVRVWDPATGRCLAQLQGHTSLVGQLQLRGDILVTGGSDGSVRVWSLLTYSAVHRLAAHDNSVTSLQFDDVRIVSGGSDGRVKVWDLATGRLVRELGAPAEAVWRVVFQEEKAVVLASRAQRTVMEVWSFAPPDEDGELAVARGVLPASIRLDGAMSQTTTPLSVPSMEMEGFQFDRPQHDHAAVSDAIFDQTTRLHHEVEMSDDPAPYQETH